MRSFAGEFTAYDPLFEFIDVGPGKERADEKITALVNFNLQDIRCEHIFLAVCHDGGYIPLLEQLAEDETVRSRITLILGAKVAAKYRTLDLDSRIELPGVFSPNEGILGWKAVKRIADLEEIMWQRKFYLRHGRQDPTAIQGNPVQVATWKEEREKLENWKVLAETLTRLSLG
ncbi:MAG: hypothetical protein Q9226_002558 [Calogaya cf. arnoldii]